ncbi:putative kinase/transcriptional regulator with XRE-family HTH domain [Streptacidiphilus sp. MAP12-33]|uniref:AAA family ATPase n=1 Tax=Streptacidiphilus sp. MAP12-33 TaxID=3156266 RepID=UPI0035139372
MSRQHPDWTPETLRKAREKHGLTLEESGELLREIGERHSLNVAANFQTIWAHEKGTSFPGPHYRRAYSLLYRLSESELGFRRALPGEGAPVQTMRTADVLPDQSQIIREALGSIQEGSDGVDGSALRERVIDAWQRRTSGDVTSGPTVLLVGGFAGSGKSEYAKFLGGLTGWPILDKDSLTRPLVDQLLVALGGEANDRSSDLYREKVRPLEYRCLMEAAWDNLDCGISTILDAPFILEFSQSDWMQRFYNRCKSKRVAVASIWVECDPDSMREYIEFRGAARDVWKMEAWDEYLASLNLELRPQGPHFIVDNRLGAAIAAADQARDMLSGGGL